MKNYNFCFTYSDTYNNEGFDGGMSPVTYTIQVPNKFSYDNVVDILSEVKIKLEYGKLDENYKETDDDNGYDFFGYFGYNANTLMEVVSHLYPKWKIKPTDINYIDFDTEI